MMKRKNLNKLIRWISFALLLWIQIMVCFFYGNRKSGFHEDEFYSYYSTNKTAGLFVNDREWLEKDQYRNEFVVLEGEQFRYQLVAIMQSWDVHPPFYYFLLHTACSLFTGVFSKWLGLGVNLIAYVINFFLLLFLTRRAVVYRPVNASANYLSEFPSAALSSIDVATATPHSSALQSEKSILHNWSRYLQDDTLGKDREGQGWLESWVVCAVWGFAPAVISGVMFIRMYEWLTLFVLLCAFIHVKAMEDGRMGLLTFYLPMVITVYLGFLTQYYYIIFHIFIGIGFCAWLIFRYRETAGLKKGIFACIKYGGACAVGLGGAFISYPASLSHIFRGYRGTEAVSEFSDLSNTWGRLRFFFGLLNDYVFGGRLMIWIGLIAFFIIFTAYIRFARAGKITPGLNGDICILLLFACLGYFVTVSKTALVLGETSNRYQLPIYGLIIMLVVIALFGFGKVFLKKSILITVGLVLASVMIFMNVRGLIQGKVFFLYEEEADIIAYARENAHADVVIFYNETSPANVWRLADEMMEYDRVYLISQGNREAITDEILQNSDKLIVYVADHEDADQYDQMIFEANPGLTECKLIAHKELWSLYEFYPESR